MSRSTVPSSVGIDFFSFHRSLWPMKSVQLPPIQVYSWGQTWQQYVAAALSQVKCVYGSNQIGLQRANIMTVLVFSRGSCGSAIWFKVEDGGRDTLKMTSVFQWGFCFCNNKTRELPQGQGFLCLEETVQTIPVDEGLDGSCHQDELNML